MLYMIATRDALAKTMPVDRGTGHGNVRSSACRVLDCLAPRVDALCDGTVKGECR